MISFSLNWDESIVAQIWPNQTSFRKSWTWQSQEGEENNEVAVNTSYNKTVNAAKTNSQKTMATWRHITPSSIILSFFITYESNVSVKSLKFTNHLVRGRFITPTTMRFCIFTINFYKEAFCILLNVVIYAKFVERRRVN